MNDDAKIRSVLEEAQVFALVGASPDPSRASNSVGRFLQRQGYRVIPVNPMAVGETLFGEPVVASLAEAAEADFLDIFRRSEAVPAIVSEAMEVMPKLRTIWMQLGGTSEAARTQAEAAGLSVIEDRCPAIEIPRLGITR